MAVGILERDLRVPLADMDGYIDDAGPERLRLSNEADWERVDQVRAECDAILIGATTLRRDNPRPLVNSADGEPVVGGKQGTRVGEDDRVAATYTPRARGWTRRASS